MIHIAINTCAGTMDGELLARRGSYNNPHKHPYIDRASKLTHILDLYHQHLPEVNIVVVGEWHPGEGYTYIHDPGATKSPEDQAQQRQAATPPYAADDDIIVYLNDDHFLLPTDLPYLCYWMKRDDIEIAAFKRAIWTAGSVEPIEDGWPNYIHGHGNASTLRAARVARWGDIDPHLGVTADIQYTGIVRHLGLTFERAPIAIYDCEVGDVPDV